MSDELDLDALEALGHAATEGKWVATSEAGGTVVVVNEGKAKGHISFMPHADAEFIVAARNYWQPLIDHIRQLEDAIKLHERNIRHERKIVGDEAFFPADEQLWSVLDREAG